MLLPQSFIDYFKEIFIFHLKSGLIAWLIIILSISIFLNYYFNIENIIVDKTSLKFSGLFYNIAIYATGYFSILIIILKKNKPENIKRFLIISFVVIFILSINSLYFPVKYLIDLLNVEDNDRYIVRKILFNSKNIFTVFIPSLFLWKYLKEKDDLFLWISLKNFKLKIYFLLLIPAILLVFIALMDNYFLKTYPTFRIENASNFLNVDRKIWYFIYEVFYLSDFIWVEFMFRGVLVIGLYTVLGKNAIIPMVSLYCFLHFGKPMAEAISSIFGGYFLGVMALYYRSITGGCFLHIGMALAMEILAYTKIY